MKTDGHVIVPIALIPASFVQVGDTVVLPEGIYDIIQMERSKVQGHEDRGVRFMTKDLVFFRFNSELIQRLIRVEATK